jgi:hypothetical protein
MRNKHPESGHAIRSEEELLAHERRRAMSRLSNGIAALPAAANGALNPVRWWRRYPLACSTLAVTTGAVLVGGILAGRRNASTNSASRPPSGRMQFWKPWFAGVRSGLRSELLAAGRRLMMRVAVGRLIWSGINQVAQAATTNENEADRPLT